MPNRMKRRCALLHPGVSGKSRVSGICAVLHIRLRSTRCSLELPCWHCHLPLASSCPFGGRWAFRSVRRRRRRRWRRQRGRLRSAVAAAVVAIATALAAAVVAVAAAVGLVAVFATTRAVTAAAAATFAATTSAVVSAITVAAAAPSPAASGLTAACAATAATVAACFRDRGTGAATLLEGFLCCCDVRKSYAVPHVHMLKRDARIVCCLPVVLAARQPISFLMYHRILASLASGFQMVTMHLDFSGMVYAATLHIRSTWQACLVCKDG